MERGGGFGNRNNLNNDFIGLPIDDKEQKSKEVAVCLVSKLWTNRSFNIRAFLNTIWGVWSPRKVVEIHELGEKSLYF